MKNFEPDKDFESFESDKDFKEMVNAGSKAWQDVPDVTKWIEDIRGNDDSEVDKLKASIAAIYIYVNVNAGSMDSDADFEKFAPIFMSIIDECKRAIPELTLLGE